MESANAGCTAAAELLPFFVKIELDGRALTFTLLLSLLTALFVGLIPALRTASIDLDQSLKEGGKSGTSAGMQRVRGLLVVTEIALAVVLLAGAGLMLRSFTRLQNTSPGFTADGVLHLEINPTYRAGRLPRRVHVAALPTTASTGRDRAGRYCCRG